MIRNINPLQFLSTPPTTRLSFNQNNALASPAFAAWSKNKKENLTFVGAVLGLLTGVVSVFGIGYGKHITPEIVQEIQLEKQLGSTKVPGSYIGHLTTEEKEKIENGDYFVWAIFTTPISQLKGAALFDVTGKIPKPVRLVDLSSKP